MSFIDTWDETKPAGSRALNLGDDDIREFKRAIRERLQFGGMYFPSTNDDLAGEYSYMRMAEQASDPAAVANKGFTYTKDSAGVTELYYMNSAGTVVQLTAGGKITLTSLGGWIARGDLIRGGASSWERYALGASGKVLKSDGTDAVWGTSQGAPTSSFKNLKVVRDSASQITVTADQLILDDGTLISSVSEAISIASSGASGLDTGSEAGATWYYAWIIRKSSDGTVNGLLSTSATSPTMPAGYDQKALVGAVRNDGSSDFIDFVQEGRTYSFKPGLSVASGNVGFNWVSVDVTAYVPSGISTFCFGTVSSNAGAVLTNDSSVTIDSDDGIGIFGSNNNQTGFTIQILTANTLYWGTSGAASRLSINGFILNKLV